MYLLYKTINQIALDQTMPIILRLFCYRNVNHFNDANTNESCGVLQPNRRTLLVDIAISLYFHMAFSLSRALVIKVYVSLLFQRHIENLCFVGRQRQGCSGKMTIVRC